MRRSKFILRQVRFRGELRNLPHFLWRIRLTGRMLTHDDPIIYSDACCPLGISTTLDLTNKTFKQIAPRRCRCGYADLIWRIALEAFAEAGVRVVAISTLDGTQSESAAL